MTEPECNIAFLRHPVWRLVVVGSACNPDRTAIRGGGGALCSDSPATCEASSGNRNRPADHSTTQLPGLPLRTLSNVVCQRGKPMPGNPSSGSLGKGAISQ